VPTLTTVINEVDVLSYNPDGTPNISAGGQIASPTLQNGALQEISFVG
jgi:hypothetical protein